MATGRTAVARNSRPDVIDLDLPELLRVERVYQRDLGPAARPGLDADDVLRSRAPYERDAQPPARHRLRLALWLLGLIAAIVLGTGVAVVFAPFDRLDLLERLLGVVFGPLITLLGTTFTWYYASIRTEHRDDRP